MSLIEDKPLFTLKQLLGAVGVAITIGGTIARFEYKSNAMSDKLDNIISIVGDYKVDTESKLGVIDEKILSHSQDIRSINNSLLTMLRPNEPVITNKRK